MASVSTDDVDRTHLKIAENLRGIFIKCFSVHDDTVQQGRRRRTVTRVKLNDQEQNDLPINHFIKCLQSKTGNILQLLVRLLQDEYLNVRETRTMNEMLVEMAKQCSNQDRYTMKYDNDNEIYWLLDHLIGNFNKLSEINSQEEATQQQQQQQQQRQQRQQDNLANSDRRFQQTLRQRGQTFQQGLGQNDQLFQQELGHGDQTFQQGLGQNDQRFQQRLSQDDQLFQQGQRQEDFIRDKQIDRIVNATSAAGDALNRVKNRYFATLTAVLIGFLLIIAVFGALWGIKKVASTGESSLRGDAKKNLRILANFVKDKTVYVNGIRNAEFLVSEQMGLKEKTTRGSNLQQCDEDFINKFATGILSTISPYICFDVVDSCNVISTISCTTDNFINLQRSDATLYSNYIPDGVGAVYNNVDGNVMATAAIGAVGTSVVFAGLVGGATWKILNALWPYFYQLLVVITNIFIGDGQSRMRRNMSRQQGSGTVIHTGDGNLAILPGQRTTQTTGPRASRSPARRR